MEKEKKILRLIFPCEVLCYHPNVFFDIANIKFEIVQMKKTKYFK